MYSTYERLTIDLTGDRDCGTYRKHDQAEHQSSQNQPEDLQARGLLLLGVLCLEVGIGDVDAAADEVTGNRRHGEEQNLSPRGVDEREMEWEKGSKPGRGRLFEETRASRQHRLKHEFTFYRFHPFPVHADLTDYSGIVDPLSFLLFCAPY